MAIISVTGKLGAGKTYWAVNYLIKKYYKWEPEILDYVSRSDQLREE